MEDLSILRTRLDELDKTLIGLFETRCRIAEQVGEYKLKTGMKIKDAAREAEVIQKRLACLSDSTYAPETEAFMQEILLQSRRIQRKLIRKNEGAPRNGNYFLVGLPGSGKTSVGKLLAQEEGMDFLDTDAYIAEREGLSIGEIFRQKGEAYFRDVEAESLRQIAQTARNTVVSTGGGIVEREENRLLLAKLCVIYLDRPIRKILQTRMSDRPLLADDPEKIYELNRRRRPFYRQVADFTVGGVGGVAATAAAVRTLLDQ